MRSCASRHGLWVENRPIVIYALDELACWPEGDPELARSSTAQYRYCWVAWNAARSGPTSFHWLAMKDFGGPHDANCARTPHLANCSLPVRY
jgi:hypothetical protein